VNESNVGIVRRVTQALSVAFGECVRILRQQQGWTQVTFSERCGFYQTYLSRIETGQANPTLNAMEVIATGLGLTVFELFDQVHQRQTPQVTATKPPDDTVPSQPESA